MAHDWLCRKGSIACKRKITAVSSDWVNLIYGRIPGWYAGIKVSCVGAWSITVLIRKVQKYDV